MNFQEKFHICSFEEFGDERGNLVVVEEMQDIPFDIKRVFYMYGTDSTMVRGMHANKKSKFVLINVAGKSKVKVTDGKNVEIIELSKPRMGLYLDTFLWKEMYDFSEDSVLLAIASEHYDASEYIRDYNEYLEIIERMEECE